MKKYDSIIFDLDGTLWDTCEGCALTWNEVLQNRDISYRNITSTDMEQIMGKTHDEIRDLFFPTFEKAFADELLQEILFQETLVIQKGGWRLYPNIKEVLQTLSQTYPLYIVSNCQEGYIQTFDLCTGLVSKLIKDFEYFSRTQQPKGVNIETVIKRNQLSNPIYIGDTLGDALAAKHAKIDFGFASYGFGQSATFELKFDQPDDICKHLCI